MSRIEQLQLKLANAVRDNKPTVRLQRGFLRGLIEEMTLPPVPDARALAALAERWAKREAQYDAVGADGGSREPSEIYHAGRAFGSAAAFRECITDLEALSAPAPPESPSIPESPRCEQETVSARGTIIRCLSDAGHDGEHWSEGEAWGDPSICNEPEQETAPPESPELVALKEAALGYARQFKAAVVTYNRAFATVDLHQACMALAELEAKGGRT